MALTKGSGFGVASSGAAASGGTITAIASGSLPTGKPVILQSDGTVKTVEGHTTGFGAVASIANMQYDIQSSFLTADKSKVFVSYRHGTTMKASIGVIDGNTVTFGAEESIGPSSTSYTSSTSDGAGNWCCTYIRYNYNDYPYVVSGTYSGTDTIEKSSAATLQTNTGSSRSSCVYSPKVNRFFIVWSSHNGGFRSFSGVPNGTSQSFSAADPIDSTNYGSGSYMWWDSTHEKIGIIYATNSSNTYINGIDLTSGGTALPGTRYKITDGADSNHVGCHHSDLGLNVVFYQDSTDGNKPKIRTFDLNDKTPNNIGTEIELQANGGSFVASSIDIHYNSGTNQCILTFRNHNDSYYGWVMPVTVTGSSSASTITEGTQTVHTAATGLVSTYDSEKLAWDDTNKKLLYHGSGKAAIWQLAGSNVSSDNFIGFPSEAVANGGSATVTVIGGISENQSGLTVGKTYYIQDDGTLSTTATTKPRAGIAIAANKLLIR